MYSSTPLRKNGQTALYVALNKKLFDTAEILLVQGVDIDLAYGEFSNTLLHTACINDDFETVKFLVRLNANQTLKNSSGWTAESIAREHNMGPILALLQ